VGDFNEITEDSEKFGAALRHRWQMENFSNTLAFCRLHDLGFSGAKFTWCNYREDDHFTQERIDRATATPEWTDLFPVRLVEVLANRSSDHTPLLISFNKQVQVFRKKWI
jgi:exonuclease III